MRCRWSVLVTVLVVSLVASVVVPLASAEQTPFDLNKLKLPPGFHLSVFADNIDSARMLTFTPGGVLLVSESGEGKVVALPDAKHTGKAARTMKFLPG